MYNQEEIDFKVIIGRILRAWPVIMLSVLFFLLLGFLFLKNYPPVYKSQITFWREKPKGLYDPSTYTGKYGVLDVDQLYAFNNQKEAIKSLPLLSEVIDSLNLGITYYESGFLFDKEIDFGCPFTVSSITNIKGDQDERIPFGTEFNIKALNAETFKIKASGEYPISKLPISISGTFRFGETINVDDFQFKVDLKRNLSENFLNEKLNEDFRFVFRKKHDLALKYSEEIKVDQENLVSSIFKVSLEGNEPLQKKKFLEALTVAFIREQLEIETSTLSKALEYIDDELAKNAAELEIQEDAIETYKSQSKIYRLSNEARVILNQTTKLENQKSELEVKKKYYDYLSEFLGDSENVDNLISPQAFLIDDPLLTKLTNDLVDLQKELNTLVISGNQSNPMYNQLLQEIESNRKTILDNIEGFKTSNQILLNDLNGRISELNRKTSEIPSTERQLLKLERNFKLDERIYLELMDRRNEIEINLASVTSDIRVLEPAHLTSSEPVFPKTLFVLLSTLALGAFIPLSILSLKSLFGNKINAVSEIERQLQGDKFLGVVSHSNLKGSEDLDKYKYSFTSEEIGLLINQINEQDEKAKLIAISSFLPKEGKSLLSALIATKYANLGQKTLVIDFNIRNADLYKYVNQEIGGPIEENLTSRNIIAACTETKVPNLFFLDHHSTKKAFIDGSTKANTLFNALKRNFDKILVDSSPFGLIAESYQTLTECDFVVVATRRGVSTKNEIEDVIEFFDHKNLPSYGVVVMDCYRNESLRNLPKNNSYFKNKPRGLKDLFSFLGSRI